MVSGWDIAYSLVPTAASMGTLHLITHWKTLLHFTVQMAINSAL